VAHHLVYGNMHRFAISSALGFISGLVTTELFRYRVQQDIDFHMHEPENTPLPLQLRYGLPESGPEVYVYENYVVRYDNAKKVPVWAMERLTKDNLMGTASRATCQFRTDGRVPEAFCSSNDDYWHSGWARGHMVPAGDHKHSQKAMEETFFLTNVVPQNMSNNANIWYRLERYCRHLVQEKYRSVEVVSGPLWLAQAGKSGRQHVKYDVIGKNNVAVPTHLFKVVVAEPLDDSDPVMAAFVVPNVDIWDGKQPLDYQVPIESVEKSVGAQFFPNLSKKDTKDLCAVDGCCFIYSTEDEIVLLQRMINGSWSLEHLEKTWKVVERKNLKSVKDLRAAYHKKKRQLTK
jgi:DNA/RNA endonuclease G (NUC1)